MRSLLKFIAPHKTIPHTPWRAEHRWQLSPSRISILFFGLAIFGLGDSLLVQGNTGNAPWTVFAQGLSLKTGLPLGVSTFLISVTVLLIWIPLKEKPGFGTLANIVLIASLFRLVSLSFRCKRALPLEFSLISWESSL